MRLRNHPRRFLRRAWPRSSPNTQPLLNEISPTFAHELTEARAALVELERKAGAGGPTAQQRAAAEKRLSKAEAAAGEPWVERRQGAEAAALDGRHALQQFATENLDALVGEVEQAGADAAEQVNSAAEAFLAAVDRHTQVGRNLTDVVALTRSMRLGDISHPRSDQARREIATLLQQGGEQPVVLQVQVPVAVPAL
jgi:hypothetical protein